MKLIIEDGEGHKTVVPLTDEDISIGRQTGNTIRLTERNVSRRHALLSQHDGAVVIEDLDSFNGVRVNGDRIQGRFHVREGDLIQIGDYDLAIKPETSAELPDRPTQPNLTPVPEAPRPRELRDEDFPFHSDFKAVERFQKAAAIQSLFSQAGREQGKRQPAKDMPFVDPHPPPAIPPARSLAASIEESAQRSPRLARLAMAALGGAAIAATAVAFAVSLRRTPETAPTAPDRRAAQPRIATVLSSTPPSGPAAAMAPAPKPAVAQPQLAAAPPETAARTDEPSRDELTQPTRAVAANPARPPAETPSSPTKGARRAKALDLYQDAIAAIRARDYPGALAKLQSALELDPSSAETQKAMAICYANLRQPDRGAYHYEQYLKLKPEAPDAADVRKMLRDYYASKGNE